MGTGILSMPVYETLTEADVTCLDYSPDMMERAKRQAEKRGLENVRFMQGDVGKLLFEDESFDLVLSLNGFHAFPDKEAAYSLEKRLKAMYRKAQVKTVEGMAAFRCRKGGNHENT